MTLQQQRAFKSDWLVKRVNQMAQDGLGIRKDILMAEFCHFFNCSFQLAPKFVKELELLGFIIIKDKMCYARGFFDNYGLQETRKEE